MTLTEYLKKMKATGAAALLTTTMVATLTGAGGFGFGTKYQQRKDEPTISRLQADNSNLKTQLAEKELHEGPLNEFLQDLRNHLAADAEIEHLFKATDLHPAQPDIGGPAADMASVLCCKEETRRWDQSFLRRAPDYDPIQQAIGQWLYVRCRDHFRQRPRNR